MKNNKRAPKPTFSGFRIADRLLASGQRLRADETPTRRTIALGYAAKWAQATGGAR